MVLQDITTYIADDGTEFSTESSCLGYEAQCRAIKKQEEEREIISAFDSLVVGEFVPDTMGLYDTDLFICKLDSEADYEIVEQYCELNRYEMDYMNRPKHFPCRYIFYVDQSNYACTEDADSFMDWAKDVLAYLDKTKNIGKEN